MYPSPYPAYPFYQSRGPAPGPGRLGGRGLAFPTRGGYPQYERGYMPIERPPPPGTPGISSGFQACSLSLRLRPNSSFHSYSHRGTLTLACMYCFGLWRHIPSATNACVTFDDQPLLSILDTRLLITEDTMLYQALFIRSAVGMAQQASCLAQVVVHNLPWSITWQELKDIFSHTPGVVRADVIIDANGRSRWVWMALCFDTAYIARTLSQMQKRLK